MKPIRVFTPVFGLLATTAIVTGACWFSYETSYIMRERVAAQFAALTLMDRTISATPHPQDADAAVFVSNGMLDKALKQLSGATVEIDGKGAGRITATVEDIGVRPGTGTTGATMNLRLASLSTGVVAGMSVEGDLVFRGVRTVRSNDGKAQAVADFAISIASAAPRLNWGFVDLPGRQLVGGAIASGLTLALDEHLAVAIPFEDRLAFDTGFARDDVVATGAGTVTLNSSLPGKVLEQRFSLATPVPLRSGLWLFARSSSAGQVGTEAPAMPKVARRDLEARVARLQERVVSATRAWEQKNDLVLFVKGNVLVDLVAGLDRLPTENRTVTVRSVKTTGQLVGDGKSFVELRDPTSAVAHLTLRKVGARWLPGDGVALSADLAMDVDAKVHAHVNPLPVGGGAGTTLRLQGTAAKTVAGTFRLVRSTAAGRAVVVAHPAMSCDSVTAEVKTDGRVVIGSFKTDLFSVGLRWTMPVPRSIGQPTLVLDDLPHRFAVKAMPAIAGGSSVKLAHDAVEYAVNVASVRAEEDGFVVAADVDLRPVDGLAPPIDADVQKKAVALAVAAAEPPACPSVKPDMRVLLGNVEIGSNGEIAKAVRNIVGDITQGPGKNNEVVKVVTTIVGDITRGPGRNNEVVRFFKKIF